jgi:3-hydroxyisobutyrate dehydrogenase-like beta-hydroxyacid dehydrogenase
MQVGFIGLGIMGSRMAANIAKAGYDVVVYNRTPEKAEAVVQNDHAHWRDTPIEVAKESDILFTMLASPEAVREMAQGSYEAEFPLRWMQKDLQLASRTAYEEGVALPGVNVIKEIYQMARKQGYGEKDFSAIYEFLKSSSREAE